MKSNRGFTLFELIVAIAIVGLLVGVVVSRMGNYLEADMKKASNRLAATIRYIYNKSITEGIYCRLIFDLNEGAYWAEASRDPVLLAAEEGSKKQKEKEEEKDKKEEAKKDETKEEGAAPEAEKGSSTQATGRIPKLELKKPVFTQVESRLLKPTRLPDGVFLKDVITEHQPVPQENGEASINFFPNGYVEHAIVNLRDEDDEVHYSLETNPITGQVKIENEYRTFEQR